MAAFKPPMTQVSTGMVTITVLDGPDRGRVYRDLITPVTIGREEGNAVQLNDERISRYHSKIQEDHGQLVLTDLDSTNGTRVNGELVQLSILRLGDRVSVGRSLLLFGSPEDIDSLIVTQTETPDDVPISSDKTFAVGDLEGIDSSELKFQINVQQTESFDQQNPPLGTADTPLPSNLSPAQAAQLSELLRHFHRGITEVVGVNTRQDDAGNVLLSPEAWQRLIRVHMELARFLYAIGHPDERDA